MGLQDIRILNKQLSQLISKPSVSSKRRPFAAISVLIRLREEPMTLKALLTTKVGMTVNKVRAQNWSEEVNQLASRIIDEWTQLLPKKAQNELNQILQNKYSVLNEEEDIEQNEELKENGAKNVSSNHNNDNSESEANEEINKIERQLKRIRYDSNKENRPLTNMSPILKTKQNLVNKTPINKRLRKLPPIGHLPEYSAERLKQRRSDNELQEEFGAIPFRHRDMLTSTPIENGVGGHQLYEKIVRKRKLERTYKMDIPRKRAMSFATVAVERYNNVDMFERPRVENWSVPHSVPVLTPADRFKIVSTRSMEKETENPKPSKDLSYKDDFDNEHDTWRVRSAKSLNRIIPRKEHKPKPPMN